MQGPEQSLEALEDDFWGDAPAGSTRLVSTVHVLRRQPVGSLDVEGLRVLIGQHVGLETLLPLALERLEEDPLAEGDFYPGDLLAAVLRVPESYWMARPEEAARVRDVVDRLTPEQVDHALAGDIAAFRARGY